MKRKMIGLSQRYASALRKHLRQSPKTSLQSARELGHQAVADGLETLDIARIHQEALATIEASSSRDGVIQRAELFFKEAITPIEKLHHAALRADAQLTEVNQELYQRTADLAVSNRSLKGSILERKTAEEALRKSGGHSKKLLEESRSLQKKLQHLTHQILAAQEDKRKKISRDLQDEIAQTLLGINVRLLTLKKEAEVNTELFKKDLAETQRLVDRSVQTIKRFAREIGKHGRA